MQQLLYLEIPTPNTDSVRSWLRDRFTTPAGDKQLTPDGFTISDRPPASTSEISANQPQLCVFVWSLQRTTYLKAFRWSERAVKGESQILQALTQQIRAAFPYTYPQPPAIAPGTSIFEALSPQYPLTVKYFQQFPNGEYDLNRVYWWEQRWRESVKNPQQPKQVIYRESNPSNPQATPSAIAESGKPEYDLIYLGGALGVIHAAMMAKLGYRVCLIERLPFGRTNREWNISRAEFEGLVEFGLFTQAEFESIVQREYVDGFNKFFDGNNPSHLKAAVLHTPKVLNVAIDANKLLGICGAKLRQYGGEIVDQTEFDRVTVHSDRVTVKAHNLLDGSNIEITGRAIVDAMGSASAIAQQINYGQAFDSVCPTVGAVLEGIEPEVWDVTYGDVLFTHGDISRGRQLIWELFPGGGKEMAVYLFHYHQVHPENPGSMLDLYEDFFTILPEYRRCDIDKLVWKKATFGYIPGHFSINANSRRVAFDRLLAIGDAASLQSPLVFTGFGSLVRNLPRLTILLDTALKHDLLSAEDLDRINAYQSNIAVTWLFSKGMMVPTGMHLPPERINSMLNTFFGVLAAQPEAVSDRFIKDRLGWPMFNRLALIAATQNPALIAWIWEMAGAGDMAKWLGSYVAFTGSAIANALLGGWLPQFLRKLQPAIESKSPKLWLRLLAWSYALNYSLGKTN
jgi:lycopene cyclase CruA